MGIPRIRRRIAMRLSGLVVLLLLTWFLGIWEWVYYEKCDLCDSRRVEVETRVLGLLISRRFHSNRLSFRATLAEDLGVPCPHSYVGALVYRRNGFLLPTFYRSFGGSLYSCPPEWYEKNRSAIIAGLLADNPAVGEEFLERVLLRGDEEYFRKLVERMKRVAGIY